MSTPPVSHEERSRVAAMLLEQHSMDAPGELRGSVLDASSRTPQRHPRPVPSTAIDSFRHQATALADLLASLDADGWQTPVPPYPWTTHGVVAHLLQVERYMQRGFGIGGGEAEPDEHDHLLVGSAALAAELHADPVDTLAAWNDAIAATVAHTGDVAADKVIVFHRIPYPASALLVARSFELWTHADDIRRALGRPLDQPSGGDLATMSNVSVSALPITSYLVTPAVPNANVRVVLTGEGGGTWDLRLGKGAENGTRSLTFVTDVVDYCRLAARRLDFDALDAEIDGDHDLAKLLAEASQAASV